MVPPISAAIYPYWSLSEPRGLSRWSAGPADPELPEDGHLPGGCQLPDSSYGRKRMKADWW